MGIGIVGRAVAVWVVSLGMGSVLGCGPSGGGAPDASTLETVCNPARPLCAAGTPACNAETMRCSRACTSDGTCASLQEQPSCDRLTSLCTTPCTADRAGAYQCVDGARHWCSEASGQPCSACPNVCTGNTFCQADACVPALAGGSACTSERQCIGHTCTAAGRCAVDQGHTCTADDCTGTCAMGHNGTTYCILPQCPSDCESHTDGGFQWFCVPLRTGGEICAPREDQCTSGCGQSLVNGQCYGTTASNGVTYHVCVPDMT